jgi:hypothetical protein
MTPRKLLIGFGTGVLAVVAVALFLRLSTPRGSRHTPVGKAPRERPALERASVLLRQTPDVAACRNALQTLNGSFSRKEAEKPAATSAEELARLKPLFPALGEGDWEEIEKPGFTLLDGIHLEHCLLMRDASRGVAPRGESAPRRAPEQEAAAALGWVVRMLQLEGPSEQAAVVKKFQPDPVLILRRGFGSSLDRALIFLALLRQLGHDGCLLAFPGSPPVPRYWACGVLGSGGQVYLFDPRLGMPLPGPGGTGIATLAQVARADSSVLARLRLSEQLHYDVTPETAAACEVHLPVPLSALSARMAWLEAAWKEKNLSPGGPVRLTQDVTQTAARFRKALADAKLPGVKVRVADWAAGLQRHFYPAEEGGSDGASRPGRRPGVRGLSQQDRLKREIVLPQLERVVVTALPPSIPRKNEDLFSMPLLRITGEFARQLTDFFFAPGQPRDLVLHGELTGAARELGPKRDRLQEEVARFRTSYEPGVIASWYEEALKAVSRPEAEKDLRQRYGKMLAIFTDGSVAGPLLIHVAYLQAQCKHEESERFSQQYGADPARWKLEEIETAYGMWRDTQDGWGRFVSEFKGAPQTLPAREQQARAQSRLAVLALAKAEKSTAAEKELARNNLSASVTLALQHQPFNAAACSHYFLSVPTVNAAEDRADARRALDSARRLWEDLAQGNQSLSGLGYLLQAKQIQSQFDNAGR